MAEFQHGPSSVAYATAAKNDWIEEITACLERKLAPHGHWTRERCLEAAAQCRTRTELNKKFPSVRRVSREGGWWAEITGQLEGVFGGFNDAIPGRLYYLRIDHPGRLTVYKIGITNRTVWERFNFREDHEFIAIVHEWEFEVGRDARDRETMVRNTFADFAYEGEKILRSCGTAEFFIHDVLALDDAMKA